MFVDEHYVNTMIRTSFILFHGTPLDMADAAYSFNITSHISVAVLYWAGDDDFPPESKLLYDKTITEHLASDILFALAVEICKKIGSPHD